MDLNFIDDHELTLERLREIALMDNQNVKRVTFQNTNISTHLIVAFFPRVYSICSLTLANCKEFKSSDMQIISFSCYSTLLELDLSANTQLKDEALFYICGEIGIGDFYCKLIHRIVLDDCPQLTNEGLKALRKLKNLKHLSCKNCIKFSDVSLVRIFTSCHDLRRLSLDGCFLLTGDCFSFIVDGCPRLNEIDLNGCYRVEDRHIRYLSSSYHHDVRKYSNLRKIKLSGCLNLTEASLLFLLQRMPIIISLNFSGCTRVSSTSILEILKRYSYFQLGESNYHLVRKENGYQEQLNLLQQSILHKKALLITRFVRRMAMKNRVLKYSNFNREQRNKRALRRFVRHMQSNIHKRNSLKSAFLAQSISKVQDFLREVIREKTDFLRIRKEHELCSLARSVNTIQSSFKTIPDRAQYNNRLFMLSINRAKSATFLNLFCRGLIVLNFIGATHQIVHTSRLLVSACFISNVVYKWMQKQRSSRVSLLQELLLFHQARSIRRIINSWKWAKHIKAIKRQGKDQVIEWRARRRGAISIQCLIRKRISFMRLRYLQDIESLKMKTIVFLQSQFRRRKVIPWRKLRYQQFLLELKERTNLEYERVKLLRASKTYNMRMRKFQVRTLIQEEKPRSSLQSENIIGTSVRYQPIGAQIQYHAYITDYNANTKKIRLHFYNDLLDPVWVDLNSKKYKLLQEQSKPFE